MLFSPNLLLLTLQLLNLLLKIPLASCRHCWAGHARAGGRSGVMSYYLLTHSLTPYLSNPYPNWVADQWC